MIPMKIILLICVCSFAEVEPKVTLVRTTTLKLKELIGLPDENEKWKDVEILIESDVVFDISAIPIDTFEYFKNVMLLYCKIMNHRFLDGRYPPWSLENLENLGKATNESISVTNEQGEKHFESALSKDDREKIEKFPIASMDENELNLVGHLLKISREIILNYDALIQPRGYLDKAFYYEAVFWLSRNMVPNVTLNAEIKKIIESERKAKNYIYNLVPEALRQEFFNPQDIKWKNTDGWKEIDVYNAVISFIDDMYISGGNAAKFVPMKCTNVEIYEKVINYSHPEYFENVLKFDRSTALRMLDKILHEKSEEKNSTVTSPYIKGMNAENVNLDDSAKFPPASVRYFKHVAILFVEAIKRKFPTIVLSETTMKDLNLYPERYAPYEMLRYCTFQHWFVPVLQEIGLKLASNENIQQFLYRSFLYRLFGWFRYQLSNTNHECEDLYFELNRFLVNQAIIHPLTVMQRQTDSSTIFDEEYKSITTIKGLIMMGDREDRALAVLLSLTNENLQEDSQLLEKIQQYLKKKQPDKKDEGNLPSDLLKCGNYIRANELAMKKLSHYGIIEPVTTLPEKIEYYTALIKKVGEKNFGTVFYCQPKIMEEKIKKKLELSCETHESDGDVRDVTVHDTHHP